MLFLKRNYGWILVAILAIAPLFILLDMVTISFVNNFSVTLNEDSGGEGKSAIKMLYHISGEFAIRWMTAVLSCTPFFIIFGVNNIFVRQAMGIATAVWSFIHFSIFLGVMGLAETFSQVNYITGFVAVLLLIPLFLTSNRKSMKLLKTKWKKLQRLAYAAIFLSLLHVAILEKTWLIYAVIISVGFVIRAPFLKQKLIAIRQNSRKDLQRLRTN